MAHPVVDQVRFVSHQARRLVLREAFAKWLCTVLLIMMAMAAADFVFRFQELPLRWLCWIAVAAVAIWSWRKLVGPAFAQHWSDRQVAQLIETRFPELRDRLSSSIAFLQVPAKDPRFGSELLRADLVRRTAASIANHNLADVLDARHARRASQALLTVTVLLGAAVAWDPDSAMLALRRLGMPWSRETWPRKHHLAFTKLPTILSYGQDFEVEVVNETGRLPSDVTLHYWFDGDDESASHAHRMVFSGGKMTHRLPAVTRSFQYRATGGDDQQMDWIELKVGVPPRIVESRIRVRPPEYSGQTAEIAERRIRGLEGSTVEIEIRVDKPVTSAVLCFKSNNGQQRYPAVVEADGHRCKMPESEAAAWILTASGTYGWELVDHQGMTVMVNDNTEVDVVPDLPPVVSIESPGADSAYTLRAVVPLRVSVKDDLAISRIEFRSGESTHTLGGYPAPGAGGLANRATAHRQLAVDHAWDLAGVPDLKPGVMVPYEMIAKDFLPQSSDPANGTIRILSNDEFQQRIDEGQTTLLQRLNEALQLQRSIHSRTSSLVAQIKSSTRLTEEDTAAWPGLEPGQQRVTNLLNGEEGATRQVDRLLAELAVNRWEAPELITHLSAVQQQLQRVADKLLPPIQQHLAEADRSLRFDMPEMEAVMEAWSLAVGGQQQVITALEELVDQLGQWDRYRNLAQEVRQVLDEHGAILQETRELPYAGRDLSSLSADERAKLDRLGARLTDLAAQVDRLQTRLDQIQQRLAQRNPSATKALVDALKVLQQEPVSGTIRDAARSISDNRLGAATRGLEETQTGLQKLLAALEQRAEKSVQQLEQMLAKAIAEFAARQESLISETTEWGKQSGNASAVTQAAQELAKTQIDLAADVRDLAEQMPESGSYRLALELATSPMQRASERLAKTQLDEPTIKIEREAYDFLKDLLASLVNGNRASQSTGDPESPEQNAKPSPESDAPSLAELKLIRLIQLEIMRRTGELEDARAASGVLSANEVLELDKLAERQRQLADRLQHSAGAPPQKQLPENNKSSIDPTTRWKIRRPVEEGRIQLVNWVQADDRATQPAPPRSPPAPSNPLDRSLLDDLLPPPQRAPTPKNSTGEDIGQPSEEASPLVEVSRQMRRIESLLQERNTTAGTQQLQRRVAAQLTSLIEQLEQQESGDETKSPQNRKDGQQTQQPKPSNSSGQAGGGAGRNSVDKNAVSNWAKGVWGVLPDRLRQQIQDMGDEQFLPEYEEIIRQYYDRLSERGRNER